MQNVKPLQILNIYTWKHRERNDYVKDDCELFEAPYYRIVINAKVRFDVGYGTFEIGPSSIAARCSGIYL